MPRKTWEAARIQAPYTAKAFLRPAYHLVKRILGRPIPEERGLRMRWGHPPLALLELVGDRSPLWIDALSGGEVTQIVTLCARLREFAPDIPLLLSSNNDYARRFAREHIPALDAVFETPWDIGFVVRRALGRLRPRALLFVENVYSPILAREARRAGIPTVLVSGLVRLAFRPHEIYHRAFGLGFHRYLDLFLVKSDLDADCLRGLGVAPDRVRIVGNLKYDDTHLRIPPGELLRLREDLGLLDGDIPIVAGSLHAREDHLVLDAFREIRREEPRARLILVPRYGHLLPGIEARLNRERTPFLKRVPGRMLGKPGSPVILVDTFGELFKLYALGRVAVLGGSFFKRHGVGFSQNIVEPLIHRLPVFFGPYTSQFREITTTLLEAWDGLEAHDANSLARGVLQVLQEEETRDRVLKGIGAILESNRHTLGAHLEALAPIVNGLAPSAEKSA